MMVKDRVVCNVCGQDIGDIHVPKVDFVRVSKKWGYFSEKDLTTHEFIMCEKCYDRIIEKFAVKPNVKRTVEAM